jgi:tetratricopeptide (TPR) repeat protein
LAQYGPAHPNTLKAKNNLAVSLTLNETPTQAELARARLLLDSAYFDACNVLGSKHPDTNVYLANLAENFFKSNDLERACLLQKRFFKWCKAYWGKTHEETLDAMLSLAIIEFNLRNIVSACRLEESVFKIRQRLLGRNHPDTLNAAGSFAASLNQMAVGLRIDEDFDAAKKVQMRAMKLMIAAHGENSLNAAVTYSSAGELMKLMGNIPFAINLFQRAIGIRERELHPDHELTVLVRNRLREVSRATPFVA